MSPLFERCFEILIGHEGGYVNDPNDRGGETKFGISKRAYPRVDIKALTLEQAKAIYAADCWTPIRGDDLAPELALLVFDCAVNSGVGCAVDLLQRACNVRRDGVLGKVTVAAASAVGVPARFHLERAMYQTKLGNWPSFGKGWCIRLATLPFQAAELRDS